MKIRYQPFIVALLLFVTAGLLSPQNAEASHFRYGTLSWKPLGGGEVEFTLIAAFRNGYGVTSVGDTFTEFIGGTGLSFGDGSSSTGTLTFEVIDINEGDDFVIAVALDPDDGERGIRHTYGGSGPFTAVMSGCCRISDLNNRRSGSYRLSTTVYPDSDNESPTTSLNPIVRVTEDVDEATFTIPATDSEGDDLRFRVAADSEAGGGSGVPSFTIDQNTGVVTLNTNTLSGFRNFWTDQVIIEELDANGDVRTQTAVDFFIQEVPQEDNPPTLTITPSGPLTVEIGEEATFDVEATDPDEGETLDLNLNSALPSGASMSPSLPISGSSPLTSTFTWTPSAGQEGSYVFNYTVEDSDDQQDQESITVDVIPEAECDMPTFTESQDGEQIEVAINANDQSGITRADFVDEDDNDYLNNLEVISVSPSGALESTDGIRWASPTGSAPPTSVTMTLERKDQTVNSASFFLTLENGCGEVLYDPEIDFAAVADAFALEGNYPNPTRGQTTVRFSLAEAASVTLTVYDMTGRKVATLIDRSIPAGTHDVAWSGRSDSGQSLSSGVYLMRLQAGNRTDTHRLTIVR